MSFYITRGFSVRQTGISLNVLKTWKLLNFIVQVGSGQDTNGCSLGHLCFVLVRLSVTMTSTDRGHAHILSPHMFTPTLYPTALLSNRTAQCTVDYPGVFSPVCDLTGVC